MSNATKESTLPIAVEGKAGWKLVPRQPTAEMDSAGYDTVPSDMTIKTGVDHQDIWKAMFDAVPSSPGKDGGQEVEAVKGVDPQIIVAVSEMTATQKRQPEWLWYNHNSERRSFGRWASYDDQAPYIRGDLATVSIVGEATRYAESLARSLHSKHYSEVTEWSPLSGDLIGILSQIDNMIAGLPAQPASTARPEERKLGFYWIKDTDGWTPWKWTAKGWTNDWVVVDYTDEEVGGIGPYIPFPEGISDGK